MASPGFWNLRGCAVETGTKTGKNHQKSRVGPFLPCIVRPSVLYTVYLLVAEGTAMELLEQRILADGKLLSGGILKVDNFLNHQMDPMLLLAMAKEWKRLFDGEGVNKILTIEASGIAMAILVGLEFQCPVVFAKKSKTKNLSDNLYRTEVPSFTHGNTNTVVVSKDYLHPGDRVLLIDDFLATGAAFFGLKALVEQAGATLVGAGAAIEKRFQGGGDALRAQGIRVESLARIVEMNDAGIKFG